MGRLELNSSVLMSGEFANTCLGRIGTSRVVLRNGQSGPFSTTRNVAGSSALKDATLLNRLRYSVFVLGSRTVWNVNSASWAVNGWPSDQVTFGRIWKVQVSPSGEASQRSANHGDGTPVLGSGLTSGSKMSSQTLRELAVSSNSGLSVAGSPDEA